MSALSTKVDSVRSLCAAGQAIQIEDLGLQIADKFATAKSEAESLMEAAGPVINAKPDSSALVAADAAVTAVDAAVTSGEAQVARLKALMAAAKRGSPGAMAKGKKARSIVEKLHAEPAFAGDISLVDKVRTSVTVDEAAHSLGGETVIGHGVRGETTAGTAWLEANTMKDLYLIDLRKLKDDEAAAIRTLVPVVREKTEVLLACGFYPLQKTVSQEEFDSSGPAIMEALRDEANRKDSPSPMRRGSI